MNPDHQYTPRPPESAASALRRIEALAFDLPIVAGWAIFSGLTGGALRLLKLDFDTPTAWDVYAFTTLVLPVALTFAFFEASQRQATPGKRRVRIRVVDVIGNRLTPRRSLARSAVKFAPWQLAHTAVFQLVAGSTATVFAVLAIVSQLVVLASVLTMAVDPHHRAIHDYVAKTCVVADVRPPGETEPSA